MRALVLSLMVWIATETGLPLPMRDGTIEIPAIAFLAPDALARQSGNRHGTIALYEEREPTIYLPLGWQADEPRDRSVLLHELVHAHRLRPRAHHRMYMTGPIALFDTNALTLVLRGRCIEEILD